MCVSERGSACCGRERGQGREGRREKREMDRIGPAEGLYRDYRRKTEGPEGWEAWRDHPESLPGTGAPTLLYSCGPEASLAERSLLGQLLPRVLTMCWQFPNCYCIFLSLILRIAQYSIDWMIHNVFIVLLLINILIVCNIFQLLTALSCRSLKLFLLISQFL